MWIFFKKSKLSQLEILIFLIASLNILLLYFAFFHPCCSYSIPFTAFTLLSSIFLSFLLIGSDVLYIGPVKGEAQVDRTFLSCLFCFLFLWTIWIWKPRKFYILTIWCPTIVSHSWLNFDRVSKYLLQNMWFRFFFLIGKTANICWVLFK